MMLEAGARLNRIRRLRQSASIKARLPDCGAAIRRRRYWAASVFENDDIIIPALMSRGLSLEDARDYTLIGASNLQAAGPNGRSAAVQVPNM